LLLRLAERSYRGLLGWALRRWWQQSSLKAVVNANQEEHCEADRGGGPPLDLQSADRAELLAELRAAQDLAVEVAAREAAKAAAAVQLEAAAHLEHEQLRAELGLAQAELQAEAAAQQECLAVRAELGEARAELRVADPSEVDLFDQPGEAAGPQAEGPDQELLAQLLEVQAEAAKSAAAEAAMARAAADLEAQVRSSEAEALRERERLQAELEEARTELAESPGRPSPKSQGRPSPNSGRRPSPDSDGSSSAREPVSTPAGRGCAASSAEEARLGADSDGSSSAREPVGTPAGRGSASSCAGEARHRAEVTMTVENVDYDALTASPDLLAEFRSAVCEAITREADREIGEEHMELTLTAGSVVVRAAITPPADISVHALHSALDQSETFHESVAGLVADIEGIEEVSSGAIAVSELRVLLVAGDASTAAPTLAAASPSLAPTLAAASPSLAGEEELGELRREVEEPRSEVEEQLQAALATALAGEHRARLEAEEVRQRQAELQEELAAARGASKKERKPNQSACCRVM